ncbi:hypothetical protein NXX33_20610 [Bacteroides fragilis]|nr:hypothetical protein [Bacteroides fragilis]
MADKKEQELTQVNSVRLLRGLDNNNESVLIAPSDLPTPYYPVAYISNALQQEGWYRLATGSRNYNMNALISMGNAWGYSSQTACIFTLLACNASIMIHKFDGYGEMAIDQIRYVQNPNSLVSDSYIDIHYRYNIENFISISVAGITNLVFESTLELTTIPEGYVATEVSL